MDFNLHFFLLYIFSLRAKCQGHGFDCALSFTLCVLYIKIMVLVIMQIIELKLTAGPFTEKICTSFTFCPLLHMSLKRLRLLQMNLGMMMVITKETIILISNKTDSNLQQSTFSLFLSLTDQKTSSPFPPLFVSLQFKPRALSSKSVFAHRRTGIFDADAPVSIGIGCTVRDGVGSGFERRRRPDLRRRRRRDRTTLTRDGIGTEGQRLCGFFLFKETCFS